MPTLFSELAALFKRRKKRLSRGGSPNSSSKHIIVIGFGSRASKLIDKLRDYGCSFTIIERDPTAFSLPNLGGKTIILGDGVDIGSLANAGIHRARALVLTTEDSQSYESVTATLGSLPNQTVVLRSSELEKLDQLLNGGH